MDNIRSTSALVPLVAAATPLTLFPVGTGRSAKIKKIMTYNGQPADVILEIGTGLAPFVRTMPRIRLISTFHDNIGEFDLPEIEFTANITCQASAAGAGVLSVEVQVEVEVIG